MALQRAETVSTSPTLLGYAVTREPLTDAQGRVLRTAAGKKQFGREIVVRNEDGTPVVRTDPILTREVFDRPGSSWQTGRTGRSRPGAAPGYCFRSSTAACAGSPLTDSRAAPDASPVPMRLGSVQATCGNKSIPLDYADKGVETVTSGLLGESERLERVWDLRLRTTPRSWPR